MGLVILNYVQMTRATPDTAPPLQTFVQHNTGHCFTLDKFNVHQARIDGGYSAESGLEPEDMKEGAKEVTVKELEKL
ncbi:hypothetical protein AVEN_181630-2 [Araneus ventricosus]|nr:hypothetical protein AVEN_181630-2 [Araneus ventricosus]